MPSAREALYGNHENSRDRLALILRSCPWKSEIRNICSKRNSPFIISDVFAAVDRFLQHSKAVIKFITSYMCTTVCLLNMARAEEVLMDVSRCLKAGKDFDTWQAINTVGAAYKPEKLLM